MERICSISVECEHELYCIAQDQKENQRDAGKMYLLACAVLIGWLTKARNTNKHESTEV